MEYVITAIFMDRTETTRTPKALEAWTSGKHYFEVHATNVVIVALNGSPYSVEEFGRAYLLGKLADA